jgi:hypothetical protein
MDRSVASGCDEEAYACRELLFDARCDIDPGDDFDDLQAPIAGRGPNGGGALRLGHTGAWVQE